MNSLWEGGKSLFCVEDFGDNNYCHTDTEAVPHLGMSAIVAEVAEPECSSDVDIRPCEADFVGNKRHRKDTEVCFQGVRNLHPPDDNTLVCEQDFSFFKIKKSFRNLRWIN